MAMDLSDLQALMGGATEGPNAGGVWVVDPDGDMGDGTPRLVGKARVIADALGTYVSVLMTGGDAGIGDRIVKAGADTVLLAAGRPSVLDLIVFFEGRSPQVILFPRTSLGRTLGAGLAQALGGGLCGYAADLEVDAAQQRIVAHQPILGDAARQRIAIMAIPAVALVDTDALPAAFSEPWRTGKVEDAGVNWGAPLAYLPAAWSREPQTLANATVVVGAGRGLKTAEGFAAAARLAEALGGVIAGDVEALDLGWITEDQLVGLTGASVAPRLFLALGMGGDTSLFMSTGDAGLIVAVQPDPVAPIVPVADYNIFADPAAFVAVLLAELVQ